MNALRKKQQGLTFISWLVILAVGGFFVLLTLKLVPIYLEHQSVKAIIEGLKTDPSLRKEVVTPKTISDTIWRKARVESLYDFPRDAIKIKKTKDKLQIDLVYDRVEPIFANISVMVSFEEHEEVELLR
jgi:hypothetical protein